MSKRLELLTLFTAGAASLALAGCPPLDESGNTNCRTAADCAEDWLCSANAVCFDPQACVSVTSCASGDGCCP